MSLTTMEITNSQIPFNKMGKQCKIHGHDFWMPSSSRAHKNQCGADYFLGLSAISKSCIGNLLAKQMPFGIHLRMLDSFNHWL